jgi:integrase
LCRHAHATIALKTGIPVTVITERLGHENPAFTMKQYAHAIPGMRADAARVVASAVRDAAPRSDRTIDAIGPMFDTGLT